MKDDQKYTEQGFWEKISTVTKVASKGLVDKALQLYYCAQSASTPAWLKATIYGALAYLIFPLDAIPDFLPGGYVDDLPILAGALSAAIHHITPEIKKRASDKLNEWFE